jgi:hypothetical protein
MLFLLAIVLIIPNIKCDSHNTHLFWEGFMTPTTSSEDRASLPFYEKVAWLTLVSAVIVYGAFAGAVLTTPAADQTVWRVVIAFTIALTVQGVVIAMAKPMLALRDPEEAAMPLDERDRSVASRAFKAAYLALLVGVVLLAMATPYASHAWQLTFAAYLATILADMIRMTATIVGYRRHG